MASHRPQQPGWYPDPDISPGSNRTLRYWDGREWTERRRPVPIMGTHDFGIVAGTHQPQALEGPARTRALPAPAAEVSAARDLPLTRSDSPNRPGGADRRSVDLPDAPAGGQQEPPEPPKLGGGGNGGSADGTDPEPRAARRRLRRKWWFVAAIAVVAAMAVMVTAQALRPPSVEPRVLTDSHFVQLANAECGQAVPPLRPPDGGPLGSLTTPQQAADQIDRAATGLDELADRLAALPVVEVDRQHITDWLAGWRAYDAAGHQYATELRQHGTPKKQPAYLVSAAQQARSVDNFARANGLKACLFTFVFVSDPSQF